jgi:hypothetical protein
MNTIQILEIGGRIKSSYLSIEQFITNPIILNTTVLPLIRKGGDSRYQKAFFPSSQSRFRQIMGDLGTYRPTIKSDQGMPGQFLPFYVNPNISLSDLSQRAVVKNEGIALPEPGFEHATDIVDQVQQAFLTFNFSLVLQLLEKFYSNQKRQADKGRIPYFFIRPGDLDNELTFGQDVLDKVNLLANEAIQELEQITREKEKVLSGNKCLQHDTNLLYGQLDVYIDSCGNVTIGEVQIPDVGFFLNSISIHNSTVLPKIQGIVSSLEELVYKRIQEIITEKKVYLVTRDEVINDNQDLLEQGDLDRFSQGLQNLGFSTETVALSQINEIPQGSQVLLFNINYRMKSSDLLVKRHLSGEIRCFPNPIFQQCAQGYFGGDSVTVLGENKEKFLKLIQPKSRIDANSILPTLSQIHKFLETDSQSTSLIYHLLADNGEIIPILANSIHSFTQLYTRLVKVGHQSPLVFRKIPFESNTSIIKTNEGSVFHCFRFMFTV